MSVLSEKSHELAFQRQCPYYKSTEFQKIRQKSENRNANLVSRFQKPFAEMVREKNILSQNPEESPKK